MLYLKTESVRYGRQHFAQRAAAAAAAAADDDDNNNKND